MSVAVAQPPLKALANIRPREHLVTDKGELTIWFVNRDIVVQRATGSGTLEIAARITSTLGAAIRDGARLHIFDDFSLLDDYTSEARVELTAWTRESLPHIQSIHILTRSKLVAMGTAVANIALGGNMQSYISRASFEAALDRARSAAGLI